MKEKWVMVMVTGRKGVVVKEMETEMEMEMETETERDLQDVHV
jgi:hypothetical protein